MIVNHEGLDSPRKKLSHAQVPAIGNVPETHLSGRASHASTRHNQCNECMHWEQNTSNQWPSSDRLCILMLFWAIQLVWHTNKASIILQLDSSMLWHWPALQPSVRESMVEYLVHRKPYIHVIFTFNELLLTYGNILGNSFGHYIGLIGRAEVHHHHCHCTRWVFRSQISGTFSMAGTDLPDKTLAGDLRGV